MHRAWLVLLVGCGFQSKVMGDGPGTDAAMDASSSDANPGICWKIDDTTNNFHVKACPIALRDTLDLIAGVSVDTDAGTSNPLGLTCAPLAAGSADICAIAANLITIESGVTLSAHGSRPLALLGHSIDIEGTIDVAGHFGSQGGPASNEVGCNPGSAATKAGGGAGGTFGGQGGKGGDQGNASSTGGPQGTTIGFTGLRGGCDGGRGGDGTTSGGPTDVAGAGGGGAVWIGVDTGTFKIGNAAKINASGAGGAGGAGSGSNSGGGFGGGSGGMIVLQGAVITRDAAAQIFANGGGGGGGGVGSNTGSNGMDPSGPSPGASGGDGATLSAAPPPGSGGPGFPDAMRNGVPGDNNQQGGGGGGGGGAGAVRVASNTTIGGPNVSPAPVKLTP